MTSTPAGRPGRADKTVRADEPLVAALDRLAAAVGVLSAQSRKRDLRTVFLLVVIVLLVVTLGVFGWTNRTISDSNTEILQTIRDCTYETAPGDCYERSQERTAGYLRDLLTAELDIAWCVKTSATKQAAAACAAAVDEPPR